MFILFGPCELYATNINEFRFEFFDFFGIMFLLFVFACVISCFILFTLSENLANCVTKTVALFDIMFYVQYFLNGKMNLLDGTEEVSTSSLVLNSLIWILFFGVAILFLRLCNLEKYSRMNYIAYACMTMQIIACVSLIPNIRHVENEKYMFTNEDEFTVSENENILVLVLDCFSNDVIPHLNNDSTKSLKCLHDFTYFDNANSVYEATFMSLANVLTGSTYDTNCSYLEWGDSIWSSEQCELFYRKLKEKNYKVHIYTDDLLAASNPENIASKIDNYKKVNVGDKNIDYQRVVKLFIKSSCYKFFPYAVKNRFYYDGDMFNDCINIEYKDEGQAPIKRNAEYYQNLIEQGLTTSENSNYFVIQHLRGLHPPYNIDENGNYVEKGGQITAAIGCMLLVEEYLSQLKRLGIYDNSTIIIMSDHGNQKQCEGVQPIFFIKCKNEKHEEFINNSAPISYEDFIPTIMQIIGVETEQRSIFDYDESEYRKRVMYVRGFEKSFDKVNRAISGGESNINVLYKYEYVGNCNDLIDLEKKKIYDIIPLYEYPN